VVVAKVQLWILEHREDAKELVELSHCELTRYFFGDTGLSKDRTLRRDGGEDVTLLEEYRRINRAVVLQQSNSFVR
jgi:hypothetical protein